MRVGAPETLGVNHQKISTTKDPLLHADISFQTDGPVLYGSEGAETGMIELQDKNVAPEVEEKPNDIVTKKQDARAVALYLNPKKTIHKKEEESSLEVYSSSAQKNTLRASLKVFFSRLGGVPHTTAVSFGVFVGCCAALFGLL